MNKQSGYSCIVVVLLLCILSCGSSDKSADRLVWGYMPPQIDNWVVSDSLEQYDREHIFDYLDGGAEIYLQDGLTNLYVIQWHNPQQDNITVELYDMTDPKGAKNIFSSLHSEIASGVGEQYEYQTGSLCFWQGKWYICIITDTESESGKATIFKLAEYISQKISESK